MNEFNIYDMFAKDRSYLLIDTNCFNHSSLQDRLFREGFVFYTLQNHLSECPTYLVEFISEQSANTEVVANILLRDFAVQKLTSLFVKRLGDDTIFYKMESSTEGIKRTKYKASMGMNESKSSALTTWCDNFNQFFHFEETREYKILESATELKNGMIVEIKDNYGNWIPRVVENSNEEWNKLYSSLSKYQKIRY